jgi:hypothetical protein
MPGILDAVAQAAYAWERHGLADLVPPPWWLEARSSHMEGSPPCAEPFC